MSQHPYLEDSQTVLHLPDHWYFVEYKQRKSSERVYHIEQIIWPKDHLPYPSDDGNICGIQRLGKYHICKTKELYADIVCYECRVQWYWRQKLRSK